MSRANDIQAQRLAEVFNRFRRAEWHKSPKEGYKSNELRVLLMVRRGSLHDERGVTVSTISAMMGVTSPTVTPLIRDLESNGLVLREHDREDRRVVRVKLTEQGKEIGRKARAAYHAYFEDLSEYLGTEDSAQLVNLLERVLQFMNDKPIRDRVKEKKESGDDGA